MDPAKTELDQSQPLYLALADRVQGDMVRAAPGSKVASEPELVARYGVSRLTARAALQELERRWLVRRVRGSGTYWTQRIDFPISPKMATSVGEMIRRSGARPVTSIDTIRTRRPSASVRDRLDLDPDDKTVAITRTGWSGSLGAWHGTTHLPLELVEGIGDALGDHSGEHVSITEVLAAEFGSTPVLDGVRAELAVMPGAVAQALDIDGRPLAWLLEVGLREARLDRPLALTERWMRADLFNVYFEA